MAEQPPIAFRSVVYTTIIRTLLDSVATYQTNHFYFSVEREREVGTEGNYRHRNMMSCGKGANACMCNWVDM